MPTNELTGKRRQSTTIERVQIIELHAEGFSQREIAKQLQIPKTTIHQVLDRWKKNKQLQALPRSGRPKVLSIKDKCRLCRLSDNNPYASL